MGFIALFCIIYEFHCTIQLAFNFFFYTLNKKFSILAKMFLVYNYLEGVYVCCLYILIQKKKKSMMLVYKFSCSLIQFVPLDSLVK